MAKRSSNKTPAEIGGRKYIVSGNNLIARVPRVRIVDLVSVDVPAVVGAVPVRVHGTDVSCKKSSASLPSDCSESCI